MHEPYIARCIALADRGRPGVKTNPLVGACIVHEDRILAEGYHEMRGASHAEVNALAAVHPSDRHLLPQARIYVSLEPCNHHGQTPPCTDAILRSGIRHVIFGMADPNKVASGGAERLLAAGIRVEQGFLADEVKAQNGHFIHHHTRQRPYITLKWAESSDGYIGRHDKRIGLTDPLANRVSHRLRSSHDAIMVGGQTLRTDHPSLTTRLVCGPNPQPVIITRDASSLPSASELMDREDTIILSGDRPMREHLEILSKSHHVGWLLVEGGREVIQQFIEAGLFDEIYRYISPARLGHGIAAPRLQMPPRSRSELDGDVLLYYAMR